MLCGNLLDHLKTNKSFHDFVLDVSRISKDHLVQQVTNINDNSLVNCRVLLSRCAFAFHFFSLLRHWALFRLHHCSLLFSVNWSIKNYYYHLFTILLHICQTKLATKWFLDCIRTLVISVLTSTISLPFPSLIIVVEIIDAFNYFGLCIGQILFCNLSNMI